MQFFQELGAGIEQRWRQKNYSEEAFPTIAADALAEADAITNVDPWEIVRQLHAVTDLPHQSIEDKFSDLPVVLYHGLRFLAGRNYFNPSTRFLGGIPGPLRIEYPQPLFFCGRAKDKPTLPDRTSFSQRSAVAENGRHQAHPVGTRFRPFTFPSRPAFYYPDNQNA